MVTYTTAAIVRAQLNDQVSTNYSDADIEEIINSVEGFIDAVLKIGTGGNIDITFDASTKKHRVLRRWANALAGFEVGLGSSASWETLDQLILCLEGLWQIHIDCMKFFSGEKTDKLDWLGE